MGLLTIMLSFFYHNGNSAINLIYFQGKATLHYESSIKNEVHTERQKKRGRQKETERQRRAFSWPRILRYVQNRDVRDAHALSEVNRLTRSELSVSAV